MRVLHSGFDLPFLAGLIVAKIVASAVSIGSGFRGGLFSTSLFIGSLFGSFIGAVLVRLGPDLRRRSVGLCAGRHGCGRRRDRRRADDDDHDRPRDDRRFCRDHRGHGRGRHRGDRGASLVRLFLRDLALPSCAV